MPPSQVFDDLNLLHLLFPDELCELNREMYLDSRPQVVVLSSFWSEELKQFMDKICNPVLLVTCAIEAAIRTEVNLVSYNSDGVAVKK